MVLLVETVAAMNLHALVGEPDRDFTGKQLGHAGFAGEADVFFIGEPGGLGHQKAGGFDFGGHVGEFELDHLKFADWQAELLALLGIFYGGIERALRHAERQSCDRDAAAVENFEAASEAFAFVAEKIFLGDTAIGKDDFGGVAGAQAELVFLFAWFEAGSSLFDDEGADAVRGFRFIGDGHGNADVGVVTVGSESFCAVDDPMIALTFGDGASATGVGARFGLGKRPCANFFALGKR